MNGFQIEHVLKHDNYTRSIFGGVYSRDTLPKRIGKRKIFVANTHRRTRRGEHWVAFFFSKKHGEYFDSFGRHPSMYPEFLEFLERNASQWKYNSKKIQSSISSTCGHHVLNFLLQRARNISMDNILNKFTNNYFNNDLYVSRKVTPLIYRGIIYSDL